MKINVLKNKRKCTVHKAMDLLGQKWTILILHHLCTDKRGFNELLTGIEGINPRALSLRLKEMIDHDLIEKTSSPEIKNHVYYSLTPRGQELKGIIKQLGKWAEAV